MFGRVQIIHNSTSKQATVALPRSLLNLDQLVLIAGPGGITYSFDWCLNNGESLS